MSELKSQIDYSKLEWFDCESNFPPMNINLYVDSEHGFGIGRLGKRVKDGSTIWSVHLDSGEVYLVYAFYKVKRWAYMEEKKTNTKLKHELMLNKDRSWVPCYIKSEADEVIADLEKSHKKEVGQLLMEIAGLKADYKEACDRLQTTNLIKDEQLAAARHQKYKRCLAMAKWCEAAALWCYQAANTLPVGFHATLYGKPVMIEPNRLFKRHALLTKWSARWSKFAEKFKEINNACM